MNNEIIKISGKPPDPDSPTSVCPGSYQSGDRYEGPVCVAEGAGQGVEQSGRPQHPFPARDIRDKEETSTTIMEKRSSSTIVEALTRHCCQKKAGQYKLPEFSFNQFCVLCMLGNTCLGPSCMGPAQKSAVKTGSTPPPQTIIPGLVGDSTLTTSTLTATVRTPTSSSLGKFQPTWGFFKSPTQAIYGGFKTSSSKSKRKVPNKPKLNVFSVCSTSAYDVAVLQQLLRSSGLSRRPSRRKTSSSSSSSPASSPPSSSSGSSSQFRKLNVSEVCCKKKKAPSPSSKLLSSTPLNSAPGYFNPVFSCTLPISDFSNPDEEFPLEVPHSSRHFLPRLIPCPPLNGSSFTANCLSIEDSVDITDAPIESNFPPPSITDDIPPIESLRSSPPDHLKRRQSPSPARSNERLHTPTKSSPSPAVSRQRTPRKDTPKKRKLPRFQCRNTGCSDFLSNSSTRAKHETQYCRMRPDTSPAVTMSNVFAVPPHAQLDLSPLQCRYPDCLKSYANENSRKKHEQEKHRFFLIKGTNSFTSHSRF